MASPKYRATQQEITESGVKYFFLSEGHKNVIKAVEYYYVTEFNSRKVYNLGFGDYNIDNDMINDNVNTNNGDRYVVFNTVLSTIPLFFQTFGDAIVWIKGSDSSDEFEAKCRETCTRNNCDGACNKNIRGLNYIATISVEIMKN
jgi:hypothetical protein